MDDNIFLLSRGRIHVQKKLRVRRECTFSSPLTGPSTKKSDGTKEFVTTGSVDRFNILMETKFVETRLGVDTTRVPFHLWEMPESL